MTANAGNRKKTTTAPAEPQDRRPVTAYNDEADPAREIVFDGEAYVTRPARLVTDIGALEAMGLAQASDNPVMQAQAMVTVARAILADDFDRFKDDQVVKHGFCSVMVLQEIVNLVSSVEGN